MKYLFAVSANEVFFIYTAIQYPFPPQFCPSPPNLVFTSIEVIILLTV